MTKEQYLALCKKPIEGWTTQDCIDASAHIKCATLDAFQVQLDSWTLPSVVRDWIALFVRVNFECCETDELLTALNCYPEYM